MDTPKLCQRVRLQNDHDKVYLVIKVDEEARTVDLISASGSTRVLEGVPFVELQGSTDAHRLG